MNTNENIKETVPKFMPAPEFAKYVGLPYRVVCELINSGELEYFMPNNKTRYVLVESYRGLARSMPAR